MAIAAALVVTPLAAAEEPSEASAGDVAPAASGGPGSGGASLSSEFLDEALGDALTASDPAARELAARTLLTGSPRTSNGEGAARIGESMIRDFPGTEHAIVGLLLVLRGRGRDLAGDPAALAALDARLDAIVADAAAPTPAFEAAAFALRREIRWAQGRAEAERGRGGDPEGFVACAVHFERLAHELGRADEWTASALYFAGECRHAAGEAGPARYFFEKIVADYPGTVARRAIEALAELALSLARFEEAARWMELYAERYPRERRAADGLEQALAIRIAIGARKEARRDLERLEALLARHDPSRAAAIVWRAGADLATTDAERIAHAEGYLRRYAAVGGLDRRLVAEATIARLTWERACPRGQINGLCVDAAAAGARSRVRRCAEPTAPIVRPRSKRPAEAAQARFVVIGKTVWKNKVAIPEVDRRRIGEFVDAAAMSRMAALDRKLEEYLAIALPSGLRLAVDADAPEPTRQAQTSAVYESKRRLSEHMARKQRLASELESEYDALRSEKQSVRATVDAPYRVGLLWEHLADQLRSAEIPRAITDPKSQAAYCAGLRELAAPIVEGARARYEFCATRAVEYQHPTDASRACEAALVRLDRARWSPLFEFVAEPGAWGDLPPRSVGLLEDPRVHRPEVGSGDASSVASGDAGLSEIASP